MRPTGSQAKMARPFDNAFSRLMSVFGDSVFILPEPAKNRKMAFSIIRGKLLKLRKKNPRFFRVFDYGWAFQSESYSSSLEMQLQLSFLQIACEIAENHPNYSKLNGIVIRIAGTKEWVPFCQAVDSWKFIVFPTPFIKALQQYTLGHILLYQGGRHLKPVFASVIRSNNLQGEIAERLVRQRPDFVYALSRDVFSPFVMTIDREVPTFLTLNFGSFLADEAKRGNSKSIALQLVSLPILAEVYVLCHELAHILEHDFSKMGRSVAEELEADRAASSLSIVADAVLKLPGSVGIAGAALFFNVLEMLQKAQFIGKLASLNTHPIQREPSGQDIHGIAASNLAQLEELQLRRRAHCLTYLMFGLPPCAEMFFNHFNELSLVNTSMPAYAAGESYVSVLSLIGSQETWWCDLKTVNHDLGEAYFVQKVFGLCGISKIDLSDLRAAAEFHLEQLTGKAPSAS